MVGLTEPNRGSALIEFLLVLPLTVLPCLLGITALVEVRAASTATEAAARQSARAFVLSTTGSRSEDRARHVIDDVMAEHRIDAPVGVVIECSHQPCLTPGGSVRVAVSVELPLLGGWLPIDGHRITGAHTARVAAYVRGRP